MVVAPKISAGSNFSSVHQVNPVPVLYTHARCSSFAVDTSFSNRQAWKTAQQNSCKAAVAQLTTGKVPHNKPGDQHNEIRHYNRHATLAPDGLITAGDSHIFTPGEPKNKLIIPHNIAPGLLYHLHNKSPGQHPSMSQLKAQFNRSFYTWNLQPLLDSLYKICYVCSVIKNSLS